MSAGLSDWSFFVEHRAEILSATLDHVELVLISMVIAMFIAVPLGMFIVQRPALRAISIGVANVFQTIPSLALFGFLIPIPFIGGIGKRTAIVALVLYALLPILNRLNEEHDGLMIAFLHRMLAVFFVGMAIVAAITALFAPYLAPFVAPGIENSRENGTVSKPYQNPISNNDWSC